MVAPRRCPELGTYFNHYFMRDPVAHALKHFVNGSEMVLRKALPEGSPMFRAAKRASHYHNDALKISRSAS